ncbi:hypothetical protein [Mesorhizobium sp. B2-7-2]|uniref:hypothetical protein n=1 Tax=Mesorhizobium sp. B2-7-2 TaxID=2589908 RepID=UPI0011282941|nr:hypothetical protein [Mesorhizobium sp. B2-7-2]TPJ28030.1 hypothetical protein FJ425_13395 [Mesorhizobium sp. B2-7-2]
MSGRRFDKAHQQRILHRQGTESAHGGDVPFGLLGTTPRLRSGYGNIEAAARWLAENREGLRQEQRHPVPELRREFGLTAKQACEAIRQANELEARS